MSMFNQALLEKIANHMVNTKCTVRQAAFVFNIPKTQVHRYITENLKEINAELACDIGKILEQNKKERHIRGGLSTKAKFEMIKQKTQETKTKK